MISLEGLTMCTGRHDEAKAILRTFAHYIKDGLIPNLFPEGARQALYHTADATLWYFHALDRYVRATDDRDTLMILFPILKGVIAAHTRGTHFGIGVDDKDGLLRAGAPGYQLTWMDAKVDDWVVTPRRGKPVEIQALWYNALRLMAQWAKRLGEPCNEWMDMAEQAEALFTSAIGMNPVTTSMMSWTGSSRMTAVCARTRFLRCPCASLSYGRNDGVPSWTSSRRNC